MRYLLLIIFTLVLTACGQSEYEIAFEAYQARDYETAFELISDLADSGDIRAQNILGLMHERAQGVERNYYEAEKW